MKAVRFFAINVNSNTYRREYIKGQCEHLGIPIEIFDAVTPSTMGGIESKYSDRRTKRQWGRPLLPTEQSCGLSHLELWRQLVRDETCDAYVILEDDSNILVDPRRFIENIDSDIHFMKLSGQHKRPQKKIKDVDEYGSIFKMAYGPLDAAAYFITKRGAKQLLAYCETLHGAIDVLMDRSYEHGVTIFSVQPYPVESWQCADPKSPLFSDIGIRDNKYASDSSWEDRLAVRLYRARLSIKKRIAEIKLRLEG